jgi:small subunit ribosomal protein S15
MTITKEKKAALISEFASKPGDNGSADVQIAVLTTRINNLTEHMKANPKDYGTRRGLQAMVARRRRHLDYVRDHNPQHYLDLLAKLGIRK